MKLTVLHHNTISEAWDWKKFAKGAGLGAALSGVALTTGNLTDDSPRYASVNRHIATDTHLVDNPNDPSTLNNTRPLEKQDISEKGAVTPLDQVDRSSQFSPEEYATIKEAADRNKCTGDLLTVLLAIRKSENGPRGREFGVLAHGAKDTNLNTQAGWSAATVVKNYKRWRESGSRGSFIAFLGNVYCPTSGDHLRPAERQLNQNWVKNVTHWYNKLQ